MARLRLWYEMPQMDNLDQWIVDIFKQSERIEWGGYGKEQAALDAICFQTSDSTWRHKIMSQKMTLQEAIDWGRTNVHTKVKNKKMEEVTPQGKGEEDTREESVGKVSSYNRRGGGRGGRLRGGGQTRGQDTNERCKQCGYEHYPTARCPAAGKDCYKCGRTNHFVF